MMQNELEIVIYISIWGVIGVILLFYILFPLKKTKIIEKTVSLYNILSIDEIEKRLEHLLELESELPRVVYSYSSGWKQEAPLTNNLQSLGSQFYSFKRKVSWHYYLRGTLKIVEGEKSSNLNFTFDQSSDYKFLIFCLFGLFLISSFIFPLIYDLWRSYIYISLSPFIFIFGAGTGLKVFQNQVEQYRKKFMEELKEKILS